MHSKRKEGGLLLVLLQACLILCAVGATLQRGAKPFINLSRGSCGSHAASRLVDLSSVSISPYPLVAGQEAQLKFSVTTKNNTFTTADNLQVQFSTPNKTTLYDVQLPVCQLIDCSQSSLQEVTRSFIVPTVFTNNGTYKARVQFTAKGGQASSCVEVPFRVRVAMAIEDDIVDEVNSNRDSGWRAGENLRFKNMTLEEASKLVGTFLDIPVGYSVNNNNNNNNVEDDQQQRDSEDTVPTTFDARTQWPGCIHPVLNQGSCGSCWAFATTEALSDRFCIASSGSVNVVLSPQQLTSCDTNNYGCNGGYLQKAWSFMQTTGVVTSTCMPYTSGSLVVPSCPSSFPGCTKYYVKASTISTVNTEAAIKSAIYTGGPVSAAFTVYSDFYSYTSGVYKHVTGSVVGGHAIELVGWGVASDGTSYWIAKNSWGTSWGMSGYFWIKRGSNECGIESNVVFGTPSVSSPTTTSTPTPTPTPTPTKTPTPTPVATKTPTPTPTATPTPSGSTCVSQSRYYCADSCKFTRCIQSKMYSFQCPVGYYCNNSLAALGSTPCTRDSSLQYACGQ